MFPIDTEVATKVLVKIVVQRPFLPKNVDPSALPAVYGDARISKCCNFAGMFDKLADMVLAPSVAGLFKWRQFEPEMILLAVGWYLRFSLS